jgi:hypothetical protein
LKAITTYIASTLFVVVHLIGCNNAPSNVPMVETEYLLVADSEGEKTVIPAGELIHPRTGDPSADKVLALNRHTGRTEWVTVETLFNEPPMQAVHLPLTRTEPNAFSEVAFP